MDIRDQAGGFAQTSGREEIGCRRKNVNRIAQRSHEPLHGLAKEPIIFNDRNQLLFGHAASGCSLQIAVRAAQQRNRPGCEYETCAKAAAFKDSPFNQATA
jgi:hypothetical protein